jgi:hypothetical protein
MRRRETLREPCRPNSSARRYKSILGSAMKVFFAALLFAAIAAVGMSVLLNTIQQPSSVAFTTGGARVGDPGNNLVGPG